MVSFESRKISDYGTLGDILRNTRESREESLERVSRFLNISYKYLFALEKGRYWELPKPVYTKNFLRSYCEYLNLSSLELEGLYLKELDVYNKSYKGAEFLEKENCKKDIHQACKAFVIPKMFKGVIAFLLVLSCSSYIFFETQKIFVAPTLVVTSPEDNYITTEPSIELTGGVAKEANVYLNGKLVLLDAKGNFEEKIPLKGGMNVIKVTASKRYSKESVILKKVMFVDDEMAVRAVDE